MKALIRGLDHYPNLPRFQGLFREFPTVTNERSKRCSHERVWDAGPKCNAGLVAYKLMNEGGELREASGAVLTGDLG